MQNFYDIARIFKHYPGDPGYDTSHAQHKTSMRDAVHSYDDDGFEYGYDDDRNMGDDIWDAESGVAQRARENAPPGTVYSSRGEENPLPKYQGGKRLSWEGDPATGKREYSPEENKAMEKGDYGSEEIYSMGNRSKTMVQKMQYLFKAKGNLAAELDRQAQSSASVRGGPEGAGGTGSFEEATNIGRGVIDSSLSAILYGQRGRNAISDMGPGPGEGTPTVEGTAVPDNQPRTDTTQTSKPDPRYSPSSSFKDRLVPSEQMRTPKAPVQNPMQEIGAQPKAGGKKGAYQPPKGAPKPAGQQYYAQDLKMVEKMARIFRV